jgi:hypothetical protein
MNRSAHTPARTTRKFAVSALAAAITLALGAPHAQVRVEAQSAEIRGRAPVVTIGSVDNETVAGQAPAVGHTLKANATATDPDDDTITGTTYKWKRGATDVGTGPEYVTTPADAGQTLTLEVTATTDAAITDPASGLATRDVLIAANTAPTAAPTITGTLKVGEELTAHSGYNDIDGDAENGTLYQWCQYNAGGTLLGCAGQQTSNKFTLVAINHGNQVVVRVTPKSATGTPNTGAMVESERTAVDPGQRPGRGADDHRHGRHAPAAHGPAGHHRRRRRHDQRQHVPVVPRR